MKKIDDSIINDDTYDNQIMFVKNKVLPIAKNLLPFVPQLENLLHHFNLL